MRSSIDRNLLRHDPASNMLFAPDGDAAARRRPEADTEGTEKPSVPHREILDINGAADYLGVSRSHLSHILAGKVPGVPAIPHVRAGRRALIRRTVIDQWILALEHGVAMAGAAQ